MFRSTLLCWPCVVDRTVASLVFVTALEVCPGSGGTYVKVLVMAVRASMLVAHPSDWTAELWLDEDDFGDIRAAFRP